MGWMSPTPLMLEGLLEADFRIHSEGQSLAFTAKPVVQPPVLVTILPDKQIHSPAIGHLVVTGAGFAGLEACVGQCHFDGTFF